jgi:hypothetical protein
MFQGSSTQRTSLLLSSSSSLLSLFSSSIAVSSSSSYKEKRVSQKAGIFGYSFVLLWRKKSGSVAPMSFSKKLVFMRIQANTYNLY